MGISKEMMVRASRSVTVADAARHTHGRLVRRLSPIVMETRLGTMRPRKGREQSDDGDDASGDGD